MRFLIIFCFLIACVGAQQCNQIKLDSKNYIMYLGREKHVFVLYTADSSSEESMWEKIAEKFANNSDALFGTVDCSAEPKLCEVHNIKKFPTVLIHPFHSVYWQEYYHELKEEAFLNFLEQYLAPECALNRLEQCNEEQEKWLRKNQVIKEEDLETIIKEHEERLDKMTASLNDYFAEISKKTKETYKKYINAMEHTHRDMKWFRSIRKDIRKKLGLY